MLQYGKIILKQFEGSIFLFFFLTILIFESCGRGADTGKSESTEFESDTVFIHELVRMIADDEITDSDSLLYLLDSARVLAEKHNYRKGLSKVLFSTAKLHYRANRYKEALRYFEKSLDIARESGDVLLQAESLERMASVCLSINDPNLSLRLYYQALPLFESVNDKKGIASVYNILGIYKTDQQEFDTALVYFEKAMKLNIEVKNDFGLMQNKGNLAYLYEKQGEIQKAEEIYRNLIAEMVQSEDKINLPVIYDNFAGLIKSSGRYEESLILLRKGIVIAEQMKDTSILESLFQSTGRLYHEINRIDSASHYFNKSIVCARVVGAVRSELNSLLMMQSVDIAEGKYKDAISKGSRIVALKDSVYARKMRNNLLNAELGYENLKKEKLIAYQQLELKIGRQKQTWYLVLFLISAFAGLLLIALIVVLRKNAVKKHEIMQERLKTSSLELEKVQHEREISRLRLERIQEEVRKKEMEQLSNALAIEQKNELLNQISGKISAAMGDSDSINADLLMQVVSSIKMQIRSSSESDQFNEKFSALHQEFYANLMQKHPELTKTELKFCAYLRIRLSGNQIANIMNVTHEAIRKTRYRIRKKMNLESDESLENYISKF